MGGDESGTQVSTESRKHQKLAAVREALRRDTASGDSIDVLTALVDALDRYRSDSAALASAG